MSSKERSRRIVWLPVGYRLNHTINPSTTATIVVAISRVPRVKRLGQGKRAIAVRAKQMATGHQCGITNLNPLGITPKLKPGNGGNPICRTNSSSVFPANCLLIAVLPIYPRIGVLPGNTGTECIAIIMCCRTDVAPTKRPPGVGREIPSTYHLLRTHNTISSTHAKPQNIDHAIRSLRNLIGV
jgi:hypothetical protein